MSRKKSLSSYKSETNLDLMDDESATRHIWTSTEDKLLKDLVEKQIESNRKTNTEKDKINWKNISDIFETMFNNGKTPYLRSGKQCRERWRNHVGVKDEKEWDPVKDDERLFELNEIHLNKWTTISRIMKKTENEVKNRFHVSIRKKINDICEQLKAISKAKDIYKKVIKNKVAYNKVNTDFIYNIIKKTSSLTNKKRTNQSITKTSSKAFEPFKQKKVIQVIKAKEEDQPSFLFIEKFKVFCKEFNTKKTFNI